MKRGQYEKSTSSFHTFCGWCIIANNNFTWHNGSVGKVFVYPTRTIKNIVGMVNRFDTWWWFLLVLCRSAYKNQIANKPNLLSLAPAKITP